jgi:hypothetical protein
MMATEAAQHDSGAFGVDGSAGLLKDKTRAVTPSLSDWPVRRGLLRCCYSGDRRSGRSRSRFDVTPRSILPWKPSIGTGRWE